jgi:Lar family restriction alleviation protein
MDRIRECPHCASNDLGVIEVEYQPVVLAVKCNECGATGPRSVSDDPKQAIFAWNQRMGRLTLVK